MSAIPYLKWPLRANIKTFSTSHNTIIITITALRLRLSLSFWRRFRHSLACPQLSLAAYYFIYIFFFIIAIRNGKQKPWNYSIKSSNSVNAPSTHMILLRVLKINNVTRERKKWRRRMNNSTITKRKGVKCKAWGGQMSTEFGENFDDVLFHFLSFRKRNEEVTKNRNGIEVNKRNRCGYRFGGGGGKTKERKMYVFFSFWSENYGNWWIIFNDKFKYRPFKSIFRCC